MGWEGVPAAHPEPAICSSAHRDITTTQAEEFIGVECQVQLVEFQRSFKWWPARG